MQIQVRGKHLDITPGIRSHVEEKVNKFEKYLDRIQTVQVTLVCQKGWQSAEINLHSDLVELRAQERSLDMYESIDLVSKKMEKQLRRFHEKLKDRTHDPRAKDMAANRAAAEMINQQRMENGDEITDPLEEGRIVRTKQISLKPTSPEEAADQMELLGHDFFVFLNSETEQINVLYLRNDGDYGLIQPSV
ncbi:MAG: ribosome-associated translation inhibitor RaiA [Armatimonadetes bacterium]|nr:ribosome-associated translation inhibitor RaiA [Armatimonadota bacterium]